ncbi:MAG TPA: Re/Si-specific NAD(P)(+) transhydrogenase subunit alpha [Longimicrobiaceae bacterium]|nr:Re/Si-specific NAD(P)(+) transhydrogenase subunit alpha [Longimicrobiaceae bacterium]
MRVAVPKESAPNEHRVALVPDSVGRLTKGGVAVAVESGAGAAAGHPDAAYADAGASIAEDFRTAVDGAAVVVKIRRPSPAEIASLPARSTLISLLQTGDDDALAAALSERSVTMLALERVPRITRAQSMDVLSSQSTVAGYKAVLVGANTLGRFLPMLTTAAGSIAPARVFVIGAGVAGLQAIATARRLGAVVTAFDVRPAVKEQVESLGAKFVATEALSAETETAGGYAREQSDEQERQTLAAIGGHIPNIDLVITTAQIPGRPAPRLITDEMVASMRPGSVIVDLAAETGGNCALTRPDETVIAHEVTILGPTGLSSSVAFHASQMFSKNVLTLLQHLLQDGELVVSAEDEVVGPMLVAQKS